VCLRRAGPPSRSGWSPAWQDGRTLTTMGRAGPPSLPRPNRASHERGRDRHCHCHVCGVRTKCGLNVVEVAGLVAEFDKTAGQEGGAGGA